MSAKRDFTDRFLRPLKPAPAGKRVIHMDAVVPRFGIRVSDKSTKEHIGAFVLVARFPGSSNPVPRRIGDFPSMTLADARQIARVWREVIARGVDPRVRLVEERHAAERRRADTFPAAFDAYADERLARLRSGDEVKKAIERYAMPRWSSSPNSRHSPRRREGIEPRSSQNLSRRRQAVLGAFENVFLVGC